MADQTEKIEMEVSEKAEEGSDEEMEAEGDDGSDQSSSEENEDDEKISVMEKQVCTWAHSPLSKARLVELNTISLSPAYITRYM